MNKLLTITRPVLKKCIRLFRQKQKRLWVKLLRNQVIFPHGEHLLILPSSASEESLNNAIRNIERLMRKGYQVRVIGGIPERYTVCKCRYMSFAYEEQQESQKDLKKLKVYVLENQHGQHSSCPVFQRLFLNHH